MAYATINVEGGLLSPDLLDRVAAGDPTTPGQTAPSFGLPRGARLQDRIQTAFSQTKTSWENFSYRRERSRGNPTQITRQAMTQGLFEIFDFPQLQRQSAATEIDGVSFRISHRAGEGESAVPVHIVGVDRKLDERGRERRSPHSLTQDFLNRSEALWGVVCNGDSVRLLRDSARVSKPAYLQFDLAAMMDGGVYGEFALMYRLMHASRFPQESERPHRCLLEDYYQQSIEEGGRVREKLRDGVKNALEILGEALLANPRSEKLRQAVQSGQLNAKELYQQLLTLIYRLLFLMVAEERGLASSANPALQTVYSRYYGISRLRVRAERQVPDDRHDDLWNGLLQTFRAFRDEDAARTLGVSPLNGDLFSIRGCKDAEAASVSNGELLKAVRELSTFNDGGVRRRVNYAHLDVEELGSVYESLLDYRPAVDKTRLAFELASGAERKRTGSYYTPPELVSQLVDSALEPVMEAKTAKARTKDEKENALLSLRVCDPAAGSGHFLLAAARRIARELAKARSGEEEPNPAEYRNAVRDVIRECIYAVDKNDLAVDLCKVALWIEGHDAGKPLGFLDHHVKVGDSLVGVADFKALGDGIPDGAYKPVSGDDKEAARFYRNRNRRERGGQMSMQMSPRRMTLELAGKLAGMDDIPEDSPAQVNERRRLHDAATRDWKEWQRIKKACDLWTYAFFAPILKSEKGELDLTPTSDAVRAALNGRQTNSALIEAAGEAAQAHRFFHWPLEFPEVFERGGFDAVLGNPPWERVKLEEKEFFRERDREIATARNKAERQRLINALHETDPNLAKEFAAAVHVSESTSRFARGGGRFPLAGRGVFNTYSIFAETARAVIAADGAAGIIVPTGIATDDTTKFFFGDLVETRSLVSLYDFENREKVFPGIDRRIKFCLLTMSGKDNPSPQAEFAFFLYNTEDLADDKRKFALAPSDFALFNPNTRTCPIFRTRRDLVIARKMYARAGVFWREKRGGQTERNPWGASLHIMFQMSGDSSLFQTFDELDKDGWTLNGNVFERGGESFLPLYEAKLFHQYDHRFATFEGANDVDLRRGNTRRVRADEKADHEMPVLPRYWIDKKEVGKKLDKKEAISIIRSTDRPTLSSSVSNGSPATRYQENRSTNRRENGNHRDDSAGRNSQLRHNRLDWLVVFRDIARSTNQRTAIFTVIGISAVGNTAPIVHMESARWTQVFRKITNATNERTIISGGVSEGGVGNSATSVEFAYARAAASALVMANMNSLPLDWAARMSVGGAHLNFFIVKQFPVLPPEAYLEEAPCGGEYVGLIVPRALELTYTSWEMRPFALDLGYGGSPFIWDEDRRHQLKCELDAVFAHMYGLERDELEYILDAPAPSASFPTLKNNETREFGEYRTRRYALAAYDQIARGDLPDLSQE